MPALENTRPKLYSLTNRLLSMAGVSMAAPMSAVDSTTSLPALTTGSTVAQPRMADTTDVFCQVRDSEDDIFTASTQPLSVVLRKAFIVSL